MSKVAKFLVSAVLILSPGGAFSDVQILGKQTADLASVGETAANLKAGEFVKEAGEFVKEAGEETDPEKQKELLEKAMLEKSQASKMDEAAKGCQKSGDTAKKSDAMPTSSAPQSPPPKNDDKKEEPPKAPVAEATPAPIPKDTPSVADTKAEEQRNNLVAQIDALNKIKPSTTRAAAKPAVVDTVTTTPPANRETFALRPIEAEATATLQSTQKEQVVTMAERLKAKGSIRALR